MAGLLRLLIVAAVLALVAKVIGRARRSVEPTAPPDWPKWSERQSTAEAPTFGRAEATTDAAVAPVVGEQATSWAEPTEDNCPDGYPVKVKLSSGIYHVAGMRNYDRTHPDRCYATAEAAEADGFRASKV